MGSIDSLYMECGGSFTFRDGLRKRNRLVSNPLPVHICTYSLQWMATALVNGEGAQDEHNKKKRHFIISYGIFAESA